MSDGVANRGEQRHYSAGLRAKRWAKWKQGLAANAAVPLRSLFGPRREQAFGILMYHRVAPVTPGVVEPTWNVPPERFRGQLEGLLSRGYEPWPLRQLVDHSAAGLAIPRNAFAVTFDDGYANNYHQAWPVLCDLGVPATIFLATSYLDSPRPFPFDDWAAAGSPGVPESSWIPLSTAQCLELRDEGTVELGCHTHTHADFRNRPDALYGDLLASLEVLRTKVGLDDATFAFPYGTRRLGFSGPVLSEAVKRAGLLCSLTTEEQLVTPRDDPFDWGRFTAHDSDTPATLAAKLDGWYTFARDAWRNVRRTTRRPQQAATVH
jgi:peptidoglycan/xylan/chitin deacetylase (PgdA/CDA1 family)